MKNFLKVVALIITNIIFVFTLTNFIVLVNVNGSINSTLTTLAKEAVVENISDNVSNKNFDITEDKELDELINKYIDIFVDGVITGKVNDNDLKQDVITFLKDNKDRLNERYDLDIKDSDIAELETSGELDEFKDSFDQSIVTLKDDMTSEYGWFIGFVRFLRSGDFIVVSVVVMIICLILNVLLMWSPYKWMLPVGISSIISSIITFINALLVTLIVFALQDSSNVNITANTSILVLISVILLVVGIALLIVNSNLKKNEKKVKA